MKRESVLNNLPQLNLGELIEQLEKMPRVWGEKKEPVTVEFDFGTAFPTRLASWRGSYSELAIGYSWCGYDKNDQHFGNITVDLLLEELKNALRPDVYFTGWKGGDFYMDEETPVWVSNEGNGSHTGITGVHDDGFQVILMTGYFEY